MDEQIGPDEPSEVVDEIDHGPGRDPSPAAGLLRARWAGLRPATRSTATALAGVAIGVAIVVGFQGVHAQPRPTPRPTVSETLPTSSALQAQDVCTSFDGQILQVSFRVTNAGQRPIDVVGIRPELPLGMLLTLRTDLDGGTCGTGPPGPADRRLQPGQSQPVTFQLLPLVSCPQPAPVAAAIDLANASQATVSVPVLVDLGSVDFPGCATSVPAPSQ